MLNSVSPTLVSRYYQSKISQIEFYVREYFWASLSPFKRDESSRETITMLMRALHDEIVATRLTYLFVDIEGAEENLVVSSELSGDQKAVGEPHPGLIDETGVRRFLGWLSD